MNIVERLVFTCPFCQKRAAIVDCDENGVGIVHDMPECEKFDRLGPTEFLMACNKTLRGRLN